MVDAPNSIPSPTDPTRDAGGEMAAENRVCVHITPRDTCDHEWVGWREFEDGNGGERVCAKCGMGAMEHSLRYGI